MYKRIAFSLLLVCCCQLAFAQDNKTQKDTARVYKKIQDYSQKRGFTKWLHGLIFEPIEEQKKTAKVTRRKVAKINYSQFEGKIIRNIKITTLDPFGYSEKDTAVKPRRYLSKVGNSVHIKSKAFTIRNLILLKRGQPLDSLLVAESERLIRRQRFVRRVVVKPVMISPKSDSVDIDIRELDSWSLIPEFSGSSTYGDFELTERNFIGLGHQASVNYEKRYNTGEDAYGARYIVPNIKNTYIRTDFAYDIDTRGNYTKSVNIERPFFSPFARWAAGAYADQRFRWDTLPDIANQYARQNFKYNSIDLWAGHAYQIFRGNSETDRTTNLISALRYLNVDYLESPTPVYDSINFYSGQRLYLAEIGIASRQFVEDKYIFNYGIVEDVPVGRVFGITGGWREKNDRSRVYAGARAAWGKYFKWGYLNTNIELGSFFHRSLRDTEQTALTFETSYFTNLIECGTWRLRQFAKVRVANGVNRLPSRGDQLTLQGNYGIPGFNPVEQFGTKKFVVSFQTQGYSPWNLAGFRLNPYLIYTIGFLAGPGQGFGTSKAYSQVGGGFIITNDYLVFSSFQISLAYYPSIPGSGTDVFKTNAFSTEDFSLNDFDMAKPRLVGYE
ncbi:POTRA domain-containing protein [Flavobacterium longum]|uniref:hypothetical protein n=1 Tax=Flavobacterium longum TaxID=1299340 RepID=UPI0039ED6D78